MGFTRTWPAWLYEVGVRDVAETTFARQLGVSIFHRLMQAAEYRDIADKYTVTIEENRRLYNEVQDLKGNIRVFCRVRPQGATGDFSEGERTAYNQHRGKNFV